MNTARVLKNNPEADKKLNPHLVPNKNQGSKSGGQLKLVFFLSLSLITYFLLVSVLWWANASFPALANFFDLPFTENGQPTRLILFLPLLTIGASLACMTLEFFIGGWEKSTFKAILNYSENPSVQSDLFYFFLRLSGLTHFFALVVSFGTLDLATTYFHRSLNLNLIGSSMPLLVQFVIFFFINATVFQVFHRMMHMKWFWEIHKVHHAAENYNILLPYRNHPVDFWLANVFFGFAGAIAGGSPEAVLGWLIANSVYQSMVHSELDWNWKWLNWILITPAAHRIHHSAAVEHIDKNFGVLSIYDRIFGTYVEPVEGQKIIVGVGGDSKFNNNNFFKEIIRVTLDWVKSIGR